MKRAAIYARVSSERQAGEDRVSIEAQLADCREHCAARGYQVAGEYVDKENFRARGKMVRPSGERKDRPAYRAMLKAAQAGEIDVIVAWKEDRLYRGLYAAMPFSEVLDERGAALDVELVRETFDRKMLGIKAAMAKIELDNIRERMLMGRRVRLERGEVPGGDQVKYGYRKVDKRLEIHEQEAEIVRKVFAWYIGGESIQNMRKRLDATGIAPRRGKRWSKATVQKIIAGEFYASGKLTATLAGEEYAIPCPPIISPETWQQSLDVRARNLEYYKPRNLKEDYLCAGIVYCACGYKMNAITHGMSRQGRRPNKAGILTGSYVCQRQYTAPETVTEECAKSAGAQTVDDFVWSYVKRICENPALVRDAMGRRLAALQAQQEGLEEELERLERSLDGLVMERQWVITQARKGLISEEDMALQLGALQMQQWSQQKELDELRGDLVAQRQLAAAQDWADQYLTNMGAGLATLELDPAGLPEAHRDYLYQDLEAWRYADRFPNDQLAQLAWAQLEERRRVVRALFGRVIVAKIEGSRQRDIRPVLTLGVPLDSETLASGAQSLDYIERKDSAYLTSLRVPVDESELDSEAAD